MLVVCLHRTNRMLYSSMLWRISHPSKHLSALSAERKWRQKIRPCDFPFEFDYGKLFITDDVSHLSFASTYAIGTLPSILSFVYAPWLNYQIKLRHLLIHCKSNGSWRLCSKTQISPMRSFRYLYSHICTNDPSMQRLVHNLTYKINT